MAEKLRTPLVRLFPDAAKSLRKVAQAVQERRNPNDEAISELANAGLEADPRTWYFKIRLRNHKESLQFEISPGEYRRLFGMAQHEDPPAQGLTFFLFDTASERIAINAREMVYCHFLFESSYFVKEEEQPEPSTSVEVFFAGDPTPLTFEVDPDDGDPDDEEDEGQFRGIFFSLDLHSEAEDRLHFVDEDGESVFIRTGDLALLRVPLFVIDPEFETDEADDQDIPDADLPSA